MSTLSVYPLKTADPGHPTFPNHPFDWLTEQIDGVDYEVEESFVVVSQKAGEPSRSYIIQEVYVSYPEGYQPVGGEQWVCTCKDFKFNRMFDPSEVDDPMQELVLNVERCKHAKAAYKSRHGPSRPDGQATLEDS